MAEFEPPGLAKIFFSDIQSVTLTIHLHIEKQEELGKGKGKGCQVFATAQGAFTEISGKEVLSLKLWLKDSKNRS